jgi:hypothetical protein
MIEMRHFQALQVLTLPAGAVLELTQQQFARRAQLVMPVGIMGANPGRYQAVREVCFKAGEVFGYAGALSKVVAQECAKPAEPAAPAAPAEPATAKPATAAAPAQARPPAAITAQRKQAAKKAR